MNQILISGANRGIGLEMARAHASEGWRVFACCRNPAQAKELQHFAKNFSNLSIHRLDLAHANTVHELAFELGNEPLDILLNNAGVYGHRNSFGSVDYDEWLKVFETNTLGVMRMAEAFVTHLERGERKTLVAISTKMASLEDNTSGGSYLYRSSKAALNMVVRNLAIDLAKKKIKCVLLHPGWVQTDMGGPNALISAEVSVEGMRKIYENLKAEDSGKFFSYTGSLIPW